MALIEAYGNNDVSCLHLLFSAQMCNLSMAHDRTVLALQGKLVALAGVLGSVRVELSPG